MHKRVLRLARIKNKSLKNCIFFIKALCRKQVNKQLERRQLFLFGFLVALSLESLVVSIDCTRNLEYPDPTFTLNF